MQGWGYSVTALDAFLLDLFEKYAELLKKHFSDDFQQVSSQFFDVRATALTDMHTDCIYRRLHAHAYWKYRRV